MICNTHGDAGYLSHETGSSYVVGTVPEMLDWVNEVELSINCNLYQPPATVDPPETWWSRLHKILRSVPHVRKRDFASGDSIICDGIAYSINRDDTSLDYAASPSSDFSDKRMNLIVAEAIRVLPYFLANYPDLHTQLWGRKLCVRMISEYADVRSSASPAVATAIIPWRDPSVCLRAGSLCEPIATQGYNITPVSRLSE